MPTNQHAGTCRRCKQTVQPGEGWVVGKRGAWTVEHTACTPVADALRYARLNAEGAGRG